MIEADVDFPKVKKFLKLDDRFLRYRLSKKKYYFFLVFGFWKENIINYKKMPKNWEKSQRGPRYSQNEEKCQQVPYTSTT